MFGVVRLTDLTQSKLATFYGQEDDGALQSVLHNVPNIVRQTVKSADIANDNNNDDDTAVQPHHVELFTVTERQQDDGNSATAAVDVASVQPDKHGAYINPLVCDSHDPDSTQVDSRWGELTDTNARRRLIRQDCTADGDDGKCDKGSASKAPQNASVSLSSEEDMLSSSTLHTFLRMASTQSTERVESTDGAGEEHSTQEVFLIFV